MEYYFQDKTGYVLEDGNCGADFTSEVLDSDCNYLGYLGGLVGNNIVNNEDFKNATLIKVISTK